MKLTNAPGTRSFTYTASGDIAAHASVRTTQVYDRRGDKVTLDEISRIRL